MSPKPDPSIGPEWDQLQRQMQVEEPACRGVAAFVRDTITKEDREAMADICGRCPLFAACTAYKKAAKPRGGHWAVVAAGRPA